jgi:hypothetical protein
VTIAFEGIQDSALTYALGIAAAAAVVVVAAAAVEVGTEVGLAIGLAVSFPWCCEI